MSKRYQHGLIRRDLSTWVKKMQKENFVQVGYSDAEWISILRKRPDGCETGLGQKMTWEQGERLFKVLEELHDNPFWCFAMPEALWDGRVAVLEGDKVGQYLKTKGINNLKIYERDMFTDDAARKAKLGPLIRYLRKEFPVVIGPRQLEGLDDVLGTFHHVDIESPNLHLTPHRVEEAARQAVEGLALSGSRLCMISAGVSAAVLAAKMYLQNPRCVYFDCGSMWDAFVGIGEQREWRARLYDNPEKLQKWKESNLR